MMMKIGNRMFDVDNDCYIMGILNVTPDSFSDGGKWTDIEKAEQLGCSGTHFVNPSGLFDENHYTTAGDLAIIAAEAMKREDFREIVGAQKWASEETDRSFVNKNKTVFNYEGGNGVKIGFTKKSGRTLVASAEREGKELIAVVLRDGNWFNDAYAVRLS